MIWKVKEIKIKPKGYLKYEVKDIMTAIKDGKEVKTSHKDQQKNIEITLFKDFKKYTNIKKWVHSDSGGESDYDFTIQIQKNKNIDLEMTEVTPFNKINNEIFRTAHPLERRFTSLAGFDGIDREDYKENIKKSIIKKNKKPQTKNQRVLLIIFYKNTLYDAFSSLKKIRKMEQIPSFIRESFEHFSLSKFDQVIHISRFYDHETQRAIDITVTNNNVILLK